MMQTPTIEITNEPLFFLMKILYLDITKEPLFSPSQQLIECRLQFNWQSTTLNLESRWFTWSSMGINPIARARRKVPGSTGSCKKILEGCVKCLVWINESLCNKITVPASVSGHPWDHCPHKVFEEWSHSCGDKQLMSKELDQPTLNNFVH